MKVWSVIPLSVLCAVLPGPWCHGVQAEKGGLAVEAKLKTLERETLERPKGGDIESRVVTVEAVFTNRGIQPFSAGQVLWGMLVRGGTGVQHLSEWHHGRTEIPGLKAAESRKLTLGEVHVSHGPRQAPDQVEFQIVVRHGNTETVRVESIAGFDTLAKSALREYGDSGQRLKGRKRGVQ